MEKKVGKAVNFNNLVAKFSQKYENGVIKFKSSEKLRDTLNKEQKLLNYGIYYIKMKEKIVYIGKAGSFSSQKGIVGQALKGRLCNKQEGMKREDYFKKMLKKSEANFLTIHWFVTWDAKEGCDLPAKIEAELLQAFILDHINNQKLPDWNKLI
ncbi:MAG: hypothetical protein PHW04_12960 [Candidatus Wallbacteria bacterium]|nr:hypothetical protein [Candidatus Wallbacteria bacterium]